MAIRVKEHLEHFFSEKIEFSGLYNNSLQNKVLYLYYYPTFLGCAVWL